MNETTLYRRIARRETHQSRSTASVVVLALVSIGAVYVGIEVVLALLGRPPLLVSPAQAVVAFGSKAAWLPWAGLGAIVFGLILVLVAIVPARRARHALPNERMAIVVDDRALAGALATEARLAAGVPKNRVRASVSRSRGLVSLTPSSGYPVSQGDAQEAADRLLAALAVSPRLRARVSVSENAVVGS